MENPWSASESSFVIRSGVFFGPVSFVSNHPKQFHNILAELKLPSNAEEIVDASRYLKGMSEICRLGGSTTFFAYAGFYQKVEELGVFGQAVVSAPSLWEALQIAKSALAYYQNASDLVIRIYGGRCHVWYFNPMPKKDAVHDVQYTMGLLANIVKLAVPASDPKIQVSYPNGSNLDFNDEPIFESIKNSLQGKISFEEGLLKSKMRGRDSHLSAVLEKFLSGKTTEGAAKTHARDLVSDLVRSSFGGPAWSLSDSAGVLRVSGRILQQRLKDEGTTFREIVNRERHTAAIQLLTSGKGIEETSEYLGFEHRQSFSEAFSKWEGRPPKSITKTVGLEATQELKA